MKNLRRITSLLLMAVMVAGLLAVPGGNVQAAKKKVQLNKKTVTLEVGKKVTLKLKNAPKKKKITWSSNKKKIATVSKKGVVTAKKAGKANITAKVSGKKYVCKVTVNNKKKGTNITETDAILTNTEGKNPSDVAALKKIIAEQNAKGAKIPLDLDAYIDGPDYDEPVYIYHWDENGRLDRLDWSSCEMSGSLDLSQLTALTELKCIYNQLKSLNVSKNTALKSLVCYNNQLKSLDVSKNTELRYLHYDF